MAKISPYYQFMERYFREGNPEEILKAKKEYRRLYKANWKRCNKKKVISIECSQKEYAEIQREAKRHHKPVSTYIKRATFSYSNKSFLVPDEATIAKILQVLKMMLLQIESMSDEDGSRSLTGLLVSLQGLETDIRITLLSPIDLYLAIKKHLIKNPADKTFLHQYIESL